MKHKSVRPTLDRSDYRSPKGLASWWSKDGAWHIALPAIDPDPVTGLRNGGFLWTGYPYPTRDAAIAAIEKSLAVTSSS